MTQPGQHGGYRKPASPAPVSGPGKMSRRTDGQPIASLPDAAYGEQKTFREIQSGAPMGGGSPGQPGAGNPLPISPVDSAGVTPLDAGSQFPGEPVTAGADAGPGVSSGVLRRPPDDPAMKYSKALLPALELAANMPFASVEFRQMVRRLRAS